MAARAGCGRHRNARDVRGFRKTPRVRHELHAPVTVPPGSSRIHEERHESSWVPAPFPEVGNVPFAVCPPVEG
jgi:hypothetical protein